MVTPAPSSGGQSPPLSTAPTAIESILSTPSGECPVCAKVLASEKRSRVDYLKPCHGWPQLVDVMVEHPCFQCFPAFKDLNIKSLLYYQAELDQFRENLHELEWEDHHNVDIRLCSDVEILLKSEHEAGDSCKQINMVREMRKVLKEYNEALLQYSKICELPEPDGFNIKNLYKWLQLNMNAKINLQGPGRNSWGELTAYYKDPISLWTQFRGLVRSIFLPEQPDHSHPDLVVPHKSKDVDSLTRWVATEGVPFWHNLREVLRKTNTQAKEERFWLFGWRFLRHSLGFDSKRSGLPECASANKRHSSISTLTLSGLRLKLKSSFQWSKPPGKNPQVYHDALEEQPSLVDYSRRSIIRFTNFVATVIACLLPIVAIAVLSKLHTQPKILGFIALFTAIFAVGIMWLTDSSTSRTEIFTATAAFSAVLVVFVQNQTPTPG